MATSNDARELHPNCQHSHFPCPIHSQMSSEERLFCIDVAVDNLTIFPHRSVPPNFPSFPSISLLVQFLSFSPFPLATDLSGTLLSDSTDQRKLIRVQNGKSALFRYDRNRLIGQLQNRQMTVVLVGNKECGALTGLLSAQLRLASAASYFIDNGSNGGNSQEQVSPAKFTSVGVTEMKDDLGRTRAQLNFGYRIWQLGASMDDFLGQHEQQERMAGGSGAAWLPTVLMGIGGETRQEHKAINNETQTEQEPIAIDAQIQTEMEIGQNAVRERGSSRNTNGHFSNEVLQDTARSNISKALSTVSDRDSSSRAASSTPDQSENRSIQQPPPLHEEQHTLFSRPERESAIRRLITELEQLTRQNTANHRPANRAAIPVRNTAPALQFSTKKVPSKGQRADQAVRAYHPHSTGPSTNSYNIYSRIYSNKALGYGLTKSYLQRLACLPFYNGGPITVHLPKHPPPVTKKIYMKDEATVCDLNDEIRAKTSQTQTDFSRTNSNYDRRTSSPLARSRQHSASALTLNDVRLLIRAIGESNQQRRPVSSTEEGNRDRPKRKRMLSINQRSISALGQRRVSMARTSSAPGRNRHPSHSHSSSSIKSDPPSRGPSPFTESVDTAIEAHSSTSSNYTSVPEQLSSNDSSVATAVEQPARVDQARGPSHSTVVSADQSGARNRASSVETVGSNRFGRTSSKRATSSSRAGTPMNGRKVGNESRRAVEEETVSPLSPVSQYLQEFKLREATRHHQLAQRALSIRTESVSSYMPSDMDRLGYSSTPSPLHTSGSKTRPSV